MLWADQLQIPRFLNFAALGILGDPFHHNMIRHVVQSQSETAFRMAGRQQGILLLREDLHGILKQNKFVRIES
jgi:hypothetical protein